MADAHDLTPEERLERIAALHQPIHEGINEGFCSGCEFPWPCPTRTLAHVTSPAQTGTVGG